MKTRPLLSRLTSSLLLLSGGCGFFQSNDNDTTEQLPPPSPEPTAEALPPVPQSTPFPDVDMAALGFIEPITPNQRRQEINKGRNNPFASIPITGQRSTLDNSGMTDANRKTVNINGDGQSDQAMSPTEAEPGKQQQAMIDGKCRFDPNQRTPGQPGEVYVMPGRGSDQFNDKLLPKQAREVVVSGIGVIEQTPFAIVKAPDEATSRSVRKGDFLSGGSIRVHEINALNSVVTLEQDGRLVLRGVGVPPLPPLTPPNSVGIPLKPSTGTGFGNVRNLTVLAVEVAETRTFGRICNTGNQQLQVKSLKFELEDLANPKKGESLETQSVNFRDPYYVEPGQQFEFEGSRLALRGRVPGQVTVKLVDWN